MTPEQEASYENEAWVNSTPKDDAQVQVFRKLPHIKDTLYKGPLDYADLQTSAAIPAIKPSSTDTLMSHLCGDTPDQFAAVIGQLIAPTIQNKSLIPRVPTNDLHAPKIQTTGSLRLRRANTTDPFLPSARMTPDHEFAIVPRQRSTKQLPPRLGDDTADAPEHVTPVETLINAKIAEFHLNEHRLPHRIKVSFIRFCQNWITTHNDEHFNYKGVLIPITSAVIGEFAVDEVRLD